MLYLESYIHRVSLAEVISRWMVNQPRAGDIRLVKKVVNFNTYIALIWSDHLARELAAQFHGVEPQRVLVKTKGQLKDWVVDHPHYSSPRIEEMRARYRKFPEDFYRDTPIDGSFYTMTQGGQGRLVGSTRLKSFRRIAEKGARRIVDFMLDRIRESADALAEERARGLGIPKSQLYTAPAEMVAEFSHAERRVIKSIKRGTIQSDMPVLAIPDAVGLKLIVEDSEYKGFMDQLRKSTSFKVLEEERHAGSYNAVNLRLAYPLPRKLLAACPPSGEYLEVLKFRGFDPDLVPYEYQDFLDRGEDHVLLEVIVSTFEEFLESELGRCMHEERVLSQRSHADYNGHLATNVRYLMDYILGLCRGPATPDITDVPIKLWVRYMPDAIDHLMRRCYLPDNAFFDSAPETPEEAAAKLRAGAQAPRPPDAS